MSKKSLQSLTALSEHGLVNSSSLPALQKVIEHFSIAITDQMHQLIDKTDPNDPIAKQFVPSVEELNISPTDLSDPIGDDTFTTVKGITHRYPDRCLFKPAHVCPVYCRFCFRREKVGPASATLTPDELEAAYGYITDHKEIWEVIFTGGEPLILKPAVLKKMITRIANIEHVEVIRIHTRVPVVDSQRINPDMIDALKCRKPVYVVLHANHPTEFTPEAIQACAALIDAGIPMLSQTVLVKDLNDNIDVLSTLMRCFVKHRIKPYYLHQGDLAKGTQHFRTSIDTGQQLMRQLRGRFSGLCQPTYVLDIPGGYGKVPIGHNYIKRENNSSQNELRYSIEDFHGDFHGYSGDGS